MSKEKQSREIKISLKYCAETSEIFKNFQEGLYDGKRYKVEYITGGISEGNGTYLYLHLTEDAISNKHNHENTNTKELPTRRV